MVYLSLHVYFHTSRFVQRKTGIWSKPGAKKVVFQPRRSGDLRPAQNRRVITQLPSYHVFVWFPTVPFDEMREVKNSSPTLCMVVVLENDVFHRSISTKKMFFMSSSASIRCASGTVAQMTWTSWASLEVINKPRLRLLNWEGTMIKYHMKWLLGEYPLNIPK